MDNNSDMFKKLTHSLLVIIVSFLPLKEAARTSILSKQWRNVWRETRNLEFNETDFVKLGGNQELQRTSFIDFVRRFVANYPRTGIQRFALACSNPERFLPDLQNFVKFAVSLDVTDLELDFSDDSWREESEDGLENHGEVFELPSSVYHHKNLKSLKLFSCRFDPSKFTNFPVLQRLSLGWVRLNGDSIKTLLECCPLLEDLSLKKCWKLQHLELTTPNLRLKNLVVDKCEFLQDWFYVESPKLKYLKYSGKVGRFLLENQNEMVEADLDFGMETEFGEMGVLLYDLLQELFSVQILTVCSVLLQMIPHGEEPMGLEAPLSVRHLIMKTAMDVREFCGMKFMFKSCPFLDTLTFHIGPAKIFPDYYTPYPFKPSEYWTKNLVVQHCMKRTLRVVNVKGFKGSMNELHVLRYILHFGAVMEQLNLYVCGDNDVAVGGNREAIVGAAKRLFQYGKASKNLQISIL